MRDLRDRQRGVGQQALGEQQPLRLRDTRPARRRTRLSKTRRRCRSRDAERAASVLEPAVVQRAVLDELDRGLRERAATRRRSRCRARARAGSAGRDGSPRLPRPPRWRRSGSSRAAACAPCTRVGSRCASSTRRRRSGRRSARRARRARGSRRRSRVSLMAPLCRAAAVPTRRFRTWYPARHPRRNLLIMSVPPAPARRPPR